MRRVGLHICNNVHVIRIIHIELIHKRFGSTEVMRVGLHICNNVIRSSHDHPH